MTTCDHFITTSPKTRDQLKYFEKCRVNQVSDYNQGRGDKWGENLGEIVAFFSLDPSMTRIPPSFWNTGAISLKNYK